MFWSFLLTSDIAQQLDISPHTCSTFIIHHICRCHHFFLSFIVENLCSFSFFIFNSKNTIYALHNHNIRLLHMNFQLKFHSGFGFIVNFWRCILKSFIIKLSVWTSKDSLDTVDKWDCNFSSVNSIQDSKKNLCETF